MRKKVYVFILIISTLMIMSACSSGQKKVTHNDVVTKETEKEKIETEKTEEKETETLETKMEKTEETEKTAGTQTKESEKNDEENLLAKIYDIDNTYSEYDVDIIEDDFDNDKTDEYFYVFTKKGTSKDDLLNYYADIWLGNELGVSRIVEWEYILPDTYGSLKLAGKTYFRYDLSYATDSQTVLLGVINGKCVESFKAAGAAHFNSNKKFTITSSAYDTDYEKTDDYYCGHSIKSYYFYIDGEGFHEYGANEISEDEFLQYPEAETILKTIKKEYGNEENVISLQYLKRCNGMLHINISCETEDCIGYYYKTYQITKDNALVVVKAGEGNYLTAVDEDIAVYK